MANLLVSYLAVDTSATPTPVTETVTLYYLELIGKGVIGSTGSIGVSSKTLSRILGNSTGKVTSTRRGTSTRIINITGTSLGKKVLAAVRGSSNAKINVSGTSAGNLVLLLNTGFSNRTLNVKGTATGSNTVTTSPPVIISIKPDDGSIIGSATIPITVIAKDAVYGIRKVEFRINGVLKATDTASPYKYSWRPTVKGLYSITITVYNAINKSATATYTVTVV